MLWSPSSWCRSGAQSRSLQPRGRRDKMPRSDGRIDDLGRLCSADPGETRTDLNIHGEYPLRDPAHNLRRACVHKIRAASLKREASLKPLENRTPFGLIICENAREFMSVLRLSVCHLQSVGI